jgi:RHH-type transcriptional regulator, proline utilization regulon repressor / proline dehydrogenase / delta 1-pyrroline-5-carboxylate dehydrogenase
MSVDHRVRDQSLRDVPPPADGLVAADDEADTHAAVGLATALLAAARDLEPRAAVRRARRLTHLFDDDESMAFSLALTDQVARISDPARAARRLRDLVAERGAPSFLGPLDRAATRAGAAVGRLLPGVVIRGVRWRLRHESADVVHPAEDRRFTRYVSRRQKEGVRLNVNLLGEAILGDDEARARLDDVMARVDRPDVDYISVKVSSVGAQLSSLAFESSVTRIADRLRELYRRATAAEPRVFVNLDMEEYRDLDLTLASFLRVLGEPEFRSIDAGIVLQAYLPDSHAAFERIATWAAARRDRGGGRIKVRLVKGANLAMEKVDAEIHGWTAAPYATKAEVDASYKALLERALDPVWGDALRIGLASHNLFDVAWGIVRADRLGTSDRLELEMLEGMAPGEAEAVRRRAGRILLYAPIVAGDEFDAAIAYLVRRLDENTSPENFLRHQFDMAPGSEAFIEQRDRFVAAVKGRRSVVTTPRRAQDRGTERQRFDLDEPFANEPDTDWSRAPNRAWLAHHLDAASDPGAGVADAVPLMIDGIETAPAAVPTDWPGRDAGVGVGLGVDPSTGMPFYRFALADAALVNGAVSVARRAQTGWGATTATHRAQLLLRCAERLASHRGQAIGVMVRDAGKTVAEADPEVSEAIDMAVYYAHAARRLDDVDDLDAEHTPLGPVVVAPPWNFPYAIPAGGVLGALAAGNTVILKPAPETVLTAWLLATCLWDAGIPRDVLQFLPCPDDEIGRALITHPDIAAVILTGSAETARLFLSWRPDLRLHAETSGKNAMVITAAADLDLAVKDLVHSAFGHAGQKCSAASLAIVEQSVIDDGRFLAKLADATRSWRVGPAHDPATDIGPLIAPPNQRLRRAFTELEPGEWWLVEPHRRDDHDHLWSPGIKVGVQPGSFLHRTECFGPVLGVMAARDLDHAIELQNATEFGLTGGLHSLDDAEIDRWLRRVEVGNAYVNRSITGAIVGRQPFGGWKRSAVGPAAKAGGPDYVAGLCHWTDRPDGCDGRLERARVSYPAAWRQLCQPQDRTGLSAERNEHRHVGLACVVLRVEADADPIDVELCSMAARTTGTRVVLSHAGDDTVDELSARWTRDPPARVRVLGTPSDALRRAAIDAWLPVDEHRPVAEGRIELVRWSREQSVSITNHRHGNTRTV